MDAIIIAGGPAHGQIHPHGANDMVQFARRSGPVMPDFRPHEPFFQTNITVCTYWDTKALIVDARGRRFRVYAIDGQPRGEVINDCMRLAMDVALGKSPGIMVDRTEYPIHLNRQDPIHGRQPQEARPQGSSGQNGGGEG